MVGEGGVKAPPCASHRAAPATLAFLKRILSLFAVTALLLSCEKEDEGCPGTTSTGTHAGCGPITGFSMVDLNGAPMAPPDTTDWRTTDNWCPWAESLFADLPTVIWVDTPLTEPAIKAYPNPCQDQFVMWLGNDTTDHVDLRIINHNAQLVHSLDSITSNNYLFDTDGWNVTDGQLFRVYYRIVHPNGTAHRGHGDMNKVE